MDVCVCASVSAVESLIFSNLVVVVIAAAVVRIQFRFQFQFQFQMPCHLIHDAILYPYNI